MNPMLKIAAGTVFAVSSVFAGAGALNHSAAQASSGYDGNCYASGGLFYCTYSSENGIKHVKKTGTLVDQQVTLWDETYDHCPTEVTIGGWGDHISALAPMTLHVETCDGSGGNMRFHGIGDRGGDGGDDRGSRSFAPQHIREVEPATAENREIRMLTNVMKTKHDSAAPADDTEKQGPPPPAPAIRAAVPTPPPPQERMAAPPEPAGPATSPPDRPSGFRVEAFREAPELWSLVGEGGTAQSGGWEPKIIQYGCGIDENGKAYWCNYIVFVPSPVDPGEPFNPNDP